MAKQPVGPLIAMGLLVWGCGTDPMRVDTDGAARAAENPPDLVAVVDAMQARTGSEIGAGLTLTGARAEAGTLALDLMHEDEAAAFTDASRDAYVFSFERDFTAQMCAAPATRRFVEERGGVKAAIVTSDGLPLASRTIRTCAA